LNTEATTLSPVMTPTTARDDAALSAVVQGTYNRYFGKDGSVVNATSSSLSFSVNRTTPDLALPHGQVLVQSQLPDGTNALGTLFFGGSTSATEARRWTWEIINQTDLLWGGRQDFPITVYLQSLVSGFNERRGGNTLGVFSYPSLDAVAMNAPSSFARTLNSPNVSGGEWLGAGALGGSLVRGSLSLTGGIRADANVFLANPHFNPEVASQFGMRTDHAPNAIALSPRLGFQWRLGGAGASGSTTQLWSIDHGAAQLRGGVGRFGSVASPTLLADAMGATGLPGSQQSILCLGDAVPTPQWDAFERSAAAIPTQCSGTTTFGNSAPSVALYDGRYRPQESWRATLGWTFTWLHTPIAVDGVYALNRHQPGTRDLNFAGVPVFALDNEEGRPVYVSAERIVPSNGGISPVASRVSPLFGRVVDNVSDLHGDARQLSVYAIPPLPTRQALLSVGYSWSDTRAQSRGFDRSTAGDPRAIGWAPTWYTPTHQFKVQIARSYGRYFGLTTSIIAMSGLPYTPIVAGDVNGDGLSNDRAFVYDPSTSIDPVLANDMKTLLSAGPAAARKCLRAQVGHLAGESTCSGPWSATMNASVVMYPALIGTNNRARMSVTFSNLLGGFDEVLHGSGHLRGWGMQPSPDQVLLRVRAFDPVTRRFAYDLNQRFGSTAPATTLNRTPFRVTIDFTLTLGRSAQAQRLEQNLRLRPALVGSRAPADSIKKRYLANYSDFIGYLLTREMGDSLALSADQMRLLQIERASLRGKADSIYASLADGLVALNENYDRERALKRVAAADEAMWSTIYAERPFFLKLFTPGQLRLLPYPIFEMLTNPQSRGRFFFSF
jgi:hypothetical protein